ncbi:MAG: FAD-dependent oxidoreductase [Actinomycetota bacterium]|nr:FAD-dependent oxidoreductase [Actinomycetota bacterium]
MAEIARKRDRGMTIATPPVANFQGSAPRGRPPAIAGASAERMDSHWSSVSRYGRRAVVTGSDALTETGTIRLAFEVTDGKPFRFEPGNFVGIECHVEGLGYRRSPYCIVSPPASDGRFQLLVRVVPDGPLSQYLDALRPGEEVAFRGPVGRSMAYGDPDDGRDLVLVATGVGVGPFLSLATHLLAGGFERDIHLFWGLRLVEDICLTDELDGLEERYSNFRYDVSLSQPPADWPGPRGRVTETMPGMLERLGGTQFLLCGNGAMIDELARALSDVGVAQRFIYEEPFFNGHHVADRAVVAAIRERFVADDLFSAFVHRESSLFALDRPLRSPGGNADPLAASDVYRGPDFLSHVARAG